MIKNIIMQFDCLDKSVMLSKRGKKYTVRCIRYKSSRRIDKLRYDYTEYAYNVAEGELDAMREIFYDEINYLTDVYGDNYNGV